jgi:hypothetical protein
MVSHIISGLHKFRRTHVFPFDRYWLAFETDIAGVSVDDTTTAFQPTNRVKSISLVFNILAACEHYWNSQ